MLYTVITTIQEPTQCMFQLLDRIGCCGGHLVVVGDVKGPAAYNISTKGDLVQFLSIQSQLDGPFELGRLLPTGHYSRKNIGYLHAIAQGAPLIYETDDDNAPMPGWQPRGEYLSKARIVAPPDRWISRKQNGDLIEGKGRWINVYKYFTDELIWPRGLPLDEIKNKPAETIFWQGDADPKAWASATEMKYPSEATSIRAPIQQGLVNNSPDVDAIWRLVLDKPFTFEECESIYLLPGNWCPFNTQSTWWWPAAYPLLYVPSNCSFRMCDIWKSFIAQRCLWAMGAGVAFHAPEVFQERNEHDLMRDFRDEIPGYDKNRELVNVLSKLELESGSEAVAKNVFRCYEGLVEADFFPVSELKLVQAWLADLSII